MAPTLAEWTQITSRATGSPACRYNKQMRVLLQHSPNSGEPPHFVQLMLQPDLFGGWTLLREASREGKSQLRRSQFEDRASAVAALKKLRDNHIKKGFKPLPPPGSNVQTEIPWL